MVTNAAISNRSFDAHDSGAGDRSAPTSPPADHAAWISTVLEEHERGLLAYASRMLGDADRARDVVQDTFLRLWEADRDAVEGFEARWLFKVCRNRALDVLRKEGRMSPLTDEQMKVRPNRADAPDDRPRRTEQAGELHEWLDKLPRRQQEVLRLKFQANLSYREISDVMDLTVSNVGVLIHTAIKSIRDHIAASDAASHPNHGGATS